MKLKKDIIPAVFTMGNMFCGFLSILFAFEGNLVASAWLVILAGFLDGIDGKLAQLLDSTSQFGIELDSFADVISFGLAPAILSYSSRYLISGKWGWILCLVFLAGGVFRLARFNVKVEFKSREFFNGLPITASAMTIASYLLFSHRVWGNSAHPQILNIMLFVFSILMISNIKYDNLPNFSFDNRWNRIKLLYVFVGILAILIKPELTLFPLGAIYILSGIIRATRDLVQSRKG